MKIENLSKELDTKAMTAVRGGDQGNANVSKQGIWQDQYANIDLTVGNDSAVNVFSHPKQSASQTNTTKQRNFVDLLGGLY